eukprot:TRINITY_DN4013_c0_g1_i3.p1 TRINITY_DN4013_c0_g1~~TRINITY_DN4013_c0_g1_i3.p1  ORF type:complete len:200 (+),score=25.68 TRINITY_DN4013_c0_g1_i3:193-792(+)
MEISDSSSEDNPFLELKTSPVVSYSPRKRLYDVLQSKGKFGKFINYFIVFLILLSLVLFVISTIPELEAYDFYFDVADSFIFGFFIAEYVLRCWTCVESKKYRDVNGLRARFYWAVEFASVIDLVAIILFFVSFVLEYLFASLIDVSFFSAVRIFRIFKMLKADKYLHALTIFSKVLKNNREVLFITALLGMMLIFLYL